MGNGQGRPNGKGEGKRGRAISTTPAATTVSEVPRTDAMQAPAANTLSQAPPSAMDVAPLTAANVAALPRGDTNVRMDASPEVPRTNHGFYRQPTQALASYSMTSPVQSPTNADALSTSSSSQNPDLPFSGSKLLKVAIDREENVVGSVEITATTTLAELRVLIADDSLEVPLNYEFVLLGAPVTLRQEAKRKAHLALPVVVVAVKRQPTIAEDDAASPISASASTTGAAISMEPAVEAGVGSDHLGNTLNSSSSAAVLSATSGLTAPTDTSEEAPVTPRIEASPSGLDPSFQPTEGGGHHHRATVRMSDNAVANLRSSIEEPHQMGIISESSREDFDDDSTVRPVNPTANASQEESTSVLYLEVVDGPLEGKIIEIDQRGVTIGRHTTNDVVVPEAGVSRFHCQIAYMDGAFVLRDKGSTTGTFFYLRPFTRYPMFKDLMVKLGESEFVVKSISVAAPNPTTVEDDDAATITARNVPVQPIQLSGVVAGASAADRNQPVNTMLTLSFFDGPMTGVSVNVGPAGLTIGRRNTNQLVIAQDGTVSGNHCKVEYFDDFHITDLGSCNGTCIRLSAEKMESGWNPIEDGDMFGTGCTKFRCTIKSRQQVNEDRLSILQAAAAAADS
eukprot:GILJ01003960.1.p1 GENE.GILJ01003960.1~~GILJ01003960.1.p1  ORF type:complete len:623 (-),score=109.09 GILJ01003960.1:167-2035(-)